MNGFDAAILDWLNRFANDVPGFDRTVVWISLEHLVKGCVVAAVMWGLWFSAGPGLERERKRGALLCGMAAGLLGEVVARALALTLPHRPRPLHNDSLDFDAPTGQSVDFLHGWSAFPSDHATLFFALATGIWFASRPAGRWMFAFVAIVICLPRVYLGLHHPTDILAGAAIGIGATTLLVQPALRRAIARPLLAWETRAPTSFYALACYFTLQLAVLFEGLRSLLRMLRGLS